jgi:hypothetical protein
MVATNGAPVKHLSAFRKQIRAFFTREETQRECREKSNIAVQIPN